VRTPLALGVVVGAESPSVASVLARLPHVRLEWLCADGGSAPARIPAAWESGATWTRELDELLADEELDAIVLETRLDAVPAYARRALEADKHVLVHGPLARSASEADALVALAEAKGRRLRAVHPSAARAGARRLRSLVGRGELGEVYYVTASRSVQARRGTDRDLIWDAAADVVALVLDLVADQPIEVQARLDSYVTETPDVLVGALRFATGIAAYLDVSRVNAQQLDRVTVVASRMTAVLDLASPGDELTLFAGPGCEDGTGARLEPGDRLVPHLPSADPLRTVCEDFVAAVRSTLDEPGARDAAAVVRVVELLAGSPALADQPVARPAAAPELRVVEAPGR
jgi:predicted dehydrogenase